MAEKPIDLTLIRTQIQHEESVPKVLEDMLTEHENKNWERGVFILIRQDGDGFVTDMRYANCDALTARGILMSGMIEEALYDEKGEE